MKTKFPIGILLLFTSALPVSAQSIKKINYLQTYYVAVPGNTSYTDSGTITLSGKNFNYRFGTASGLWTKQMQKIYAFRLNTGECYERVSTSHTVKIRRADNTFVTGNTTVLWMEGDSSANGANLNIRPVYEESMETAFSSTYYNWGTDNLFDNVVPGTNNNNIERFDVIFPAGYTIGDKNTEGFALFERGIAGAHDPVKIAGISSLNGSQDPNGYKAMPVSITTADWGDIPGSTVQHVVLRKEPTHPHLIATGVKPQDRGGLFIPFGSLGFANGDVVYGYSLMAPDVNPGSLGQLNNYNNHTVYPLTTSEPDGGLDLIGDADLFRYNSMACILPVTFSAVNAVSTAQGVVVQWETVSEKDNAVFEVEHSVDGIHFIKAGSVKPQQFANGAVDYSFLHKNPAAGANYYRIRQVDYDGHSTYTKVIKIVVNVNPGKGLSIFPNPLASSDVNNLQVKAEGAGEYTIQIINSSGKVVFTELASTSTGLINLNGIKKINSGIYTVILHNIRNGQTLSNKLIVQ